MTYSIVARDAASGELGVAVQSRWLSVGSDVTWAEAGVGAVATQSFVNVDYGPLGLEGLRRGESPEAVLRSLLAADEGEAVRQVGMVDASGRVAAHTGSACVASAGHLLGDGFTVQANLMDNDGVVPAMKAAFESARGPLSARLLATLDAAEAAGGDIRGRQSAALLVVSGERTGKPWAGKLVELRVEDHEYPLRELARLLTVHAAYTDADRALDLANAGGMGEALDLIAAARKLVPGDDQLAFFQAQLLFSAGRTAEAEAALREAMAANPRWPAALERFAAAGHASLTVGQLRLVKMLASPAGGTRDLQRV